MVPNACAETKGCFPWTRARPHSVPLPPRGQRLSVGRVRVDLHRFGVPMHAKKPKALHEPSEVPPAFGLRQSSGALAMEASRPKAPEDWRSPRRSRAIRRFRVPMRDIRVEEALHEPRMAPSPQPSPPATGERGPDLSAVRCGAWLALGVVQQ